jgi:hypothetical protein
LYSLATTSPGRVLGMNFCQSPLTMIGAGTTCTPSRKYVVEPGQLPRRWSASPTPPGSHLADGASHWLVIDDHRLARASAGLANSGYDQGKPKTAMS